MSSTCMLLKMMEKSRNSVCSPKKFVLRVSPKKKSYISNGPEKKNSCKVKISPTPSLFSKSILFTSGAGVSDHFLSDNHSPNDIELIPLELIHSSRDALTQSQGSVPYRKGSNS